ncbi:hypothetical protein BC829DRAFT_386489 [Chytridium lagenaria]|nr:hypothetical protein BC829DRAFT_386489 [Chytridium lagenaria]
MKVHFPLSDNTMLHPLITISSETAERIASYLSTRDLVNASSILQPLSNPVQDDMCSLTYKDWKILGINYLAVYLSRGLVALPAYFSDGIWEHGLVVMTLTSTFEHVYTWKHGFLELLTRLGLPTLLAQLEFDDQISWMWESLWNLCNNGYAESMPSSLLKSTGIRSKQTMITHMIPFFIAIKRGNFHVAEIFLRYQSIWFAPSMIFEHLGEGFFSQSKNGVSALKLLDAVMVAEYTSVEWVEILVRHGALSGEYYQDEEIMAADHIVKTMTLSETMGEDRLKTVIASSPWLPLLLKLVSLPRSIPNDTRISTVFLTFVESLHLPLQETSRSSFPISRSYTSLVFQAHNRVDPRIVNLFLDYPSRQSKSKHLKFVIACKDGDTETVAALLADACTKPFLHQNQALMMACENGHEEIVVRLLRRLEGLGVPLQMRPGDRIDVELVRQLCETREEEETDGDNGDEEDVGEENDEEVEDDEDDDGVDWRDCEVVWMFVRSLSMQFKTIFDKAVKEGWRDVLKVLVESGRLRWWKEEVEKVVLHMEKSMR